MISAHDRRMWFSVAALCGLGVAGTLTFLVMERRVNVDTIVWLSLMVSCLAIGLFASVRAAAGALLAVGIPLMLANTLDHGGTASHYVAYFPLAVVVTWSWFGRRWAVLVLALCCATIAYAWYYVDPSQGPGIPQLAFSHALACVLVAASLGSIIADLRAHADLTWRQMVAAEAAARVAREANEARDRFLSAVSHELRTPLDVVLGYAELAEEVEEDPDRLDDVRRIRAAGSQLLALINDLIDAGSGRVPEAEVGEVDLAALVDDVVQTCAPTVSAAGNVVQVRMEAATATIISDRRRLLQILLNLVSNASKYTRSGTIWLKVSDRGEEVAFSVEDSGIGIPEDQLSRLFQPFVQLHTGADRRPGLGLGLALSQRLAERLGGRISAVSQVGVGSTFTLSIPRAAEVGVER